MANAKDIFKNAVILFLITAVVAALLAGANLLTKETISKNAQLAEQSALSEVISAERFLEVNSDAFALIDASEPIQGAYVALNGDELVGYCIKVTPTGYGGAIEVIYGLDRDLTFTGVSILSHGETPGFGANIEKEDFKAQFKGKTDIIGAAKTEPKENEIQALSGATISSNAMARGAGSAKAAASWLSKYSADELVKGGTNQ